MRLFFLFLFFFLSLFSPAPGPASDSGPRTRFEMHGECQAERVLDRSFAGFCFASISERWLLFARSVQPQRPQAQSCRAGGDGDERARRRGQSGRGTRIHRPVFHIVDRGPRLHPGGGQQCQLGHNGHDDAVLVWNAAPTGNWNASFLFFLCPSAILLLLFFCM